MSLVSLNLIHKDLHRTCIESKEEEAEEKFPAGLQFPAGLNWVEGGGTASDMVVAGDDGCRKVDAR